MQTPWYLLALELEPGVDERSIRRAYAVKLKGIDQELDPEGFQRLRQAYEHALLMARATVAEATEEANPVSSAAVDNHDVAFDPNVESTAHQQLEVEILATSVDEVDPELEADQVLQVLLKQVRTRANDFSPSNLKPLLALMQEALQDPALIHIEARRQFEFGVAKHLVNGWIPGNESLFAAAIRVFDWSHDNRRLREMGWVGNTIDAAIVERGAYLERPDPKLNYVIERLRNPNRPTPKELVELVPAALHLVKRYPNLLNMSADLNVWNNWRTWSEELPPRLRKRLDKLYTEQVPAPAPATGDTSWAWRVGIIVALAALRLLFNH